MKEGFLLVHRIRSTSVSSYVPTQNPVRRSTLAPGDAEVGTPVIAAGKFKLWLKDSLVIRYQLRLEGVMLVKKKKVLVRQMSETRVSTVGRTEFTVPDEARLKLGGLVGTVADK